jgi:PKD repeat protein
MTDVPMFYSINGNRVDETIDNVSASSSATHTFASKPVFNTPGVNTVVIGLGCDDDASNNLITQTITITPSPSGADLVQSSTWNGYFRTGNMADPDVTVPDYEVIYDIQAPSKYTSATLGSDWTVANNSMIVGGAAIGATEGVNLDATNGTLSVDPVASLQGKTLYLSVVISDVNTGCDSTIGRYMYVPYTPVVDFEANNICLGDVAQFKNRSTLAGPDYMLNTWDFDDPDPAVTDDNSDIQDGFWNYTKFGTPNVTLTVVNGKYPLFEYSVTKTVTVTPKPVIAFKVLNKCFGTPVEFNNTTAMPDGSTAGITYSWSFGDGGTSTLEDPTHSYASPGQRVVTLVATKTGCVDKVSKNAYQFEMPTSDFTSTGACNFEEIEFTNASTIPNGAKMGYAWDFGDGGISRFPDPKHAFATAGTKTVKLKTTSEFGCVNEVTKTITLNESPEANFTWDKACNLTPINFTRTGSVPNGGANTSYTWNFDGQATSGMENPSHLFPRVGTKKVTLTASDLNGCSSSITKEVPVVLQAVAAFEASSVCEGDEAVFTNKSTVAAGNLQYVWKFGDGNTSTDLSPRHRYAVTGTTQIIGVTLEAIVPGGCSDQVTKSITVNAAPDASFTPDVQGRTVAFDGPSGNSIYQWRFGDGSKATTEDPIYTYTNVDQGTFEVCLATKNAECWSEECQTITINLAGVEELTENNDMITVYPNPNAGSFNLTIDNAKADVVIKVGDILGNEIPATVVNNLNGKYSVDLSAVANGVYFVQVKNGNYYATKRITVSK